MRAHCRQRECDVLPAPGSRVLAVGCLLQAAAHKEAQWSVFARQDRLLEVAEAKKREALAKEAADKERQRRCVCHAVGLLGTSSMPESVSWCGAVTPSAAAASRWHLSCSEFEDYRRAVAAAEVKDAADKRLASAEFRAALDLQVRRARTLAPTRTAISALPRPSPSVAAAIAWRAG